QPPGTRGDLSADPAYSRHHDPRRSRIGGATAHWDVGPDPRIADCSKRHARKWRRVIRRRRVELWRTSAPVDDLENRNRELVRLTSVVDRGHVWPRTTRDP